MNIRPLIMLSLTGLIMSACAPTRPTAVVEPIEAVTAKPQPADVFGHSANGDYHGVITYTDGTMHPMAAKVIDYGPEGYRASLLPEFDTRVEVIAVLEGDEANLQSTEGSANQATAVIEGEMLIGVVEGDHGGIFRLKRTLRLSPTLNSPAPKDAMVLLGNGDLSAWVHPDGRPVEWTPIAGGFQVKSGTQSAVTAQKFTNFTLHLEFRTPVMLEKRGQQRGNSGMYLQGRYEVQVLDSYGLKGENNEAGGIYEIAPPLVNMAAPPGQWQTYGVEFTAARYDAAGNKTARAQVTVKHNGVIIHDNLQLPQPTPGGIDQDETIPGGLFLQDHGDPVEFRNIWIIEN